MRRAMAADSSSGVPSLPETDRGDAAEARPRMGGATADKYGLKQLVLFHSKHTFLNSYVFVTRPTCCVTPRVLQSFRMFDYVFCYAAHMLCYATSVANIHVFLFRFILERGAYFFLLRGHHFSMKTILGVL